MKTRRQRKLAFLLACLQVIAPAAMATDISDVPMVVKNVVSPNLMFVLDDSGSMQWEVIPDSTKVYLTFPRPGTLYGSTYYGYGTFDQIPTFDIANKYARCYRNAQCNALYYNPSKLYKPWLNADGSSMANMVATAACHNPYRCSGASSEGTTDLTTNKTYTRNWVANDGSDSSYSLTFYPATYFEYTGSGTAPTTVGAANNTAANYTKVEIKSAAAPFVHTNASGRTDCSISGTTATCTYAQEIQNFANWYSYYRSRILTARAGAGRAFALQGTGMRVGFATINKGSTTVDGVSSTRKIVTGVRAFTGTDRSNWFTNFYDYTMPTAGTPLRQALDDVGQYFKRTDDKGPWGEFPGTGGGTQWACRQNYSILMTDGYWNGSGASVATGNVDNTNGSTKTRTDSTTYQYIARNPHSDGNSNTLADVAMYYWVNDLRADIANKVVPANNKDPAFWQHMVTFTVGLGVYGTIPKSTIEAAFTAMNSVPLTPAPTSNMVMTTPVINWPTPCDTCTTENVDDLAHAAINGRGNYFSASDPDEFADALTDALNDVNARAGAAAAVAVANANVTAGDNTSYASSYNSGTWTGTLNAFAVDVTTGIPSSTSLWTPSLTPPEGGAQSLLDTRAASSRFIVSYSGDGYSSSGVQFQPDSASTTTKLSASQTSRLATPSVSDAGAVIDYLRGDRSGESSGTYRVRAHLLGDIINSEPVVIRAPFRRYTDPGYLTWKVAQASRTKMVVQGANDGMVHVFNGSATTGVGGIENWAYVPNRLIAMSDPANSGTSVLNMLSRKTYSHRMYVDATPTQGDADFCNTANASCTTGATDWRTIVVGGLGKGGRGVYALDMTTPDATSESNATTKVLWEFPNASTNSTVAANVGYVFGRPVIVRTRAKGWVVLVAAGYNNGTGTDNSGGDGKGYLFVLNARTGELIKAISTTVGSTADPSGLAHIAAFVQDAEYNPQVLQVYGGDLKGNVWRFDLTDADTANWGVRRLAVLKDGSSATQPVTTEPALAQIKISDGTYKRFIYVGTGKYLGDADVTDSQTQTMYGLIDDLSQAINLADVLTPVIADSPTRSNLQVQTLTTTASGERTATGTSVDFSTKKGWYVDLPDTSTAPSERVNTHPTIVSGALVFTSNIPSSDACIPGGSSWLNVLDYQTGGRFENGWSSKYLGDALASRVVVIKTTQGLKYLVRTSSGETKSGNLPFPTPSTAGRRAAWRELIKFK
mgnify:CR=1 FL=1